MNWCFLLQAIHSIKRDVLHAVGGVGTDVKDGLGKMMGSQPSIVKGSSGSGRGRGKGGGTPKCSPVEPRLLDHGDEDGEVEEEEEEEEAAIVPAVVGGSRRSAAAKRAAELNASSLAAEEKRLRNSEEPPPPAPAQPAVGESIGMYPQHQTVMYQQQPMLQQQQHMYPSQPMAMYQQPQPGQMYAHQPQQQQQVMYHHQQQHPPPPASHANGGGLGAKSKQLLALKQL